MLTRETVQIYVVHYTPPVERGEHMRGADGLGLMNRVGEDLEFRSYWAEPAWVRQGAFVSWTKAE